MAGRESRERPASGAARDYRLKRFELKTENRSRNNGSGQRFIASNGDSRHPTGGVERDAPHRARPPPHQTVCADFLHTASRVKLSLPIPLACQRNQSHMLKFAIVCLCIFQLIPSLAPAVQPDVHSELYVLIDLAEHLGGTPATEVSTPSAPYVLCRSQTHDIGFIQSERLASGSRPSRGFDTRFTCVGTHVFVR